jgi:hypothetical protein
MNAKIIIIIIITNNTTKYLEFNKGSILDLAEKNYKNLVEVLTNKAIDTADYSSEIYHNNSKGDIAQS